MSQFVYSPKNPSKILIKEKKVVRNFIHCISTYSDGKNKQQYFTKEKFVSEDCNSCYEAVCLLRKTVA